MATITYLVAPCGGPSSLLIEFSGSSLPVVGKNYYLNYTGATTDGCAEVVDIAEPGTGTDGVLTLGTDYEDCTECLAANPTPTPTPTPTVTPTKTVTPTVTPTTTPTETVTPSVTATNTPTTSVTPSVTPTNTVTPSVTPTNTVTPSVTPTNTPSLTPTKTPTNTPTTTPTPSPTPPGFWIITDCDETIRIVDLVGVSPTIGEMYLLQFSGSTPYGCYFITDTSYGPSTDIGSSLGGPYIDCTECGAVYTGVSVNSFYETVGFCCESGTTSPGAAYPHPVYAAPGGVAIQLNAVALGGFNGLNN